MRLVPLRVSDPTQTSAQEVLLGIASYATIKNVVNLAGVTFAFVGSSITLRITGKLMSQSAATIRNCVDYCSITHFGLKLRTLDELLAHMWTSTKHLQDRANYGILIHQGIKFL